MSMNMEPDAWTLPDDHKPYTDKYFIHSREILEQDDTDSAIGIKVFARGDGPIPEHGLDQARQVFEQYAEPAFSDNGGALWMTERDTFDTKDPLMIIEGNIQDVIELETMYLGVLSHHLTDAHPDYDLPDPDTFGEQVGEAAAIYDEEDIPLLYFGARHYHPRMDYDLAGAALDNGAVQTSTDIGSSNIGEDGVGTTPHILTLALVSMYGEADATRKTAELFEEHIDPDGPGTTLVDTFNREIDDALDVAAYIDAQHDDDDWYHRFRVDTCGENVAQGADDYGLDAIFADTDLGAYGTGTGVRVAGVAALRDALIDAGYGDNTGIILSSGFGNPDKARAFVNAQQAYQEETGYDLFEGVGAGAFADGIHCTADMYMADDEPLYKDGREVDLDAIETYKENHMEQVISQ